ncbi:hypothetical protein C8Q78DRAFT_100679 [Trametes maxima]|nr:hypothetical protein C8Q78DRAFT_100679 [Trametes maxima]
MLSLVVLAASAGMSLAAVTPTAPGPGDSFAAGSDCTIKWNADSTGEWKNVSLYLMSGSNDNMTKVTTVLSGFDGTDTSLSPYNWTCPEVDPYSAIYFYQFTNGDDTVDSAWTTRFTITSSSGASTSPEHDTQPNGDAIPWGKGELTSGDDDVSAQSAADSSEHDAERSDADDDDTDDPPSTATRTRKHGTTDASSETASSSLDGYGNSSGPRPSRTARATASGESAEDLIPTASLPTKKAHASRSGSPSAAGPSGTGMPCSGMGPGVPQMGGMKLASSASVGRRASWLGTLSIYPVLVAMLL